MLLGLVVVLLAAESAARLLATHLEPVYDWPRSDYIQHEQALSTRAGNLEMLILGSSLAGLDLSPDQLRAAGAEGPGYNYWLAGAPMRSISLLTTDVLLKRATPSTVIVGVSMREFNEGPSQQSHVEALERSDAFRVASGRQSWIDSLDHRLQAYSALARHRLSVHDPVRLVRELQAPKAVPERLGPDGFLADRGQARLADEPPEHVAQERGAMANYAVNDGDLTALAQLLDELHSRGITVLVVNLPVTDQFIDLADDGRADYDRYVALVGSLTAAHHGRWLDTMTQPWPNEYFGDVNHLNDRGVDELRPLVSAALAETPSP